MWSHTQNCPRRQKLALGSTVSGGLEQFGAYTFWTVGDSMSYGAARFATYTNTIWTTFLVNFLVRY